MVYKTKDGFLVSNYEDSSIALNNLISIYNNRELARKQAGTNSHGMEKDSDRYAALLLSDLDKSVREEDLLPLFGHAVSRILQIDIARDSETGQGLGYAHVIFEYAGAADTALDILGGEGSIVRVSDKG